MIAAGHAPNNSFNRSAISAAFIENLRIPTLDARPVNSGVSYRLRSQAVFANSGLNGLPLFKTP